MTDLQRAEHHGPALDPFGTSTDLTGRIDELCVAARARGAQVVLLAASLSNGDEIADALGAAALGSVTECLVARLVQDDQRVHLLRCSPLGGFLAAVVVEHGDGKEHLEQITRRLRGLVEVSGHRLWPVVTAGLRRCEADDEGWLCLRDVRATLFSAGRSHRGSMRWYGADADGPRDERDLELVSDLAVALHEDPAQITMAYQPVFDLRSGTLISAEALMRWHHPERGNVSPLEAVGAAERSGLIHPLGQHVLEISLRQTALWIQHVGPAYRTHVNVSALELQEPGYVERVAAALERTGVAPERLLLEITETAVLTTDQGVLQTLYRLRALGVGLGIDDFGTGYSSISHLHRLPIDTVKVDRSLVRDIGTSPADFALIRTVLGLLATTQVTVIAEGIEDAVQSSHLQAVGAVFGQGYLLGRPMRPEIFLPTVFAARHASA